MTQKEYEQWTAITQNSQFRWTEDAIYRLNGRGAHISNEVQMGGYS